MFVAIGIGEFMFLLTVIIVLMSVTAVDIVTTFTRVCENSFGWLRRIVTGKTGNLA